MTKRRRELESIVRLIADEMVAEMNNANTGPPIGFMLMLFDFGPGGFSAYVSNAARADMVRLLREQADRMEAGTDATKGEA